jgi:hypothetical protein
MHPGNLAIQEAAIIWEFASKFPNGRFVEINPGTGRTTIILGTVAKNIGATVDLQVAPFASAETVWLSRGIIAHGLFGVVMMPGSLTHGVSEVPAYDLVLVNGEFEDWDRLTLKPGAIIVSRRSATPVPDAVCIENRFIPTISVWRSTRAEVKMDRYLELVK